jgi:hypothetical protein
MTGPFLSIGFRVKAYRISSVRAWPAVLAWSGIAFLRIVIRSYLFV